MQFQYWKVIHVLPKHRKETVKHFAGNLNSLYIQDHHLINCDANYNLEKLSSRELYHLQYLLKYDKPNCEGYHEKKFDEYNFNWKLIHRIPRIATFETKVRIFQYRSLFMYYILTLLRLGGGGEGREGSFLPSAN